MSSYLSDDRMALASPIASDRLLTAIPGGPAGVVAGTTTVMPAGPLSNWVRPMSASPWRAVRQP
jgi:hypothetical protein